VIHLPGDGGSQRRRNCVNRKSESRDDPAPSACMKRMVADLFDESEVA